MDIAIVGRHTRVSDEMRERITAKMEKISALAPKATRVEVHVVHERNPKLAADAERVEITLHDKGVIRAEASADDRVAALELASARILDRLRKMHERHAHRHQGKPVVPMIQPAEQTRDVPVESVEAWEGAPESAVREIGLAGTPIVIRSKVHPAQSMTIAEAIDQMELVGHDFYLFIDSETSLPSAVYRRRGWTYGVVQIDPQREEPEERASA